MKTAIEILTNICTTNYGLKFIPITKEEWEILKPLTESCDWTEYDMMQIDIQFMNGDYAFLDAEYQKPIDNEYDLGELYSMYSK